MTTGEVVVVAGVGPGNGAALARRFAVDGARVAMLGRDKDRADALAAECRRQLHAPRPGLRHRSHGPPIRLVIFGSGGTLFCQRRLVPCR